MHVHHTGAGAQVPPQPHLARTAPGHPPCSRPQPPAQRAAQLPREAAARVHRVPGPRRWQPQPLVSSGACFTLPPTPCACSVLQQAPDMQRRHCLQQHAGLSDAHCPASSHSNFAPYCVLCSCLVDPRFRDQFAIAQPTPQYDRVLKVRIDAYRLELLLLAAGSHAAAVPPAPPVPRAFGRQLERCLTAALALPAAPPCRPRRLSLWARRCACKRL